MPTLAQLLTVDRLKAIVHAMERACSSPSSSCTFTPYAPDFGIIVMLWEDTDTLAPQRLVLEVCLVNGIPPALLHLGEEGDLISLKALTRNGASTIWSLRDQKDVTHVVSSYLAERS